MHYKQYNYFVFVFISAKYPLFYYHFILISFYCICYITLVYCHKSIDSSKLVNVAGPDKTRHVSKAYVTGQY